MPGSAELARVEAMTALATPGSPEGSRPWFLTGLIIIAVLMTLMALMALGVSGIQWKLPVPMPAAGPGPGSARIPRRDIVSTFTSRDVEATDNPDQALAVLDDHLATLFG